jgi:antitoxin (DNA-binding transcriptional repressor) of toxin-antitoxin stability system
MKTVAVSKIDSKLDSLLGSAQKERVVLTRAGKPSAILIGIESYDAEDMELATSGEFWQMIQSRRNGPSISLSDLKSKLADQGAVRSHSKRGGRRAKQTPPPKRTGKK